MFCTCISTSLHLLWSLAYKLALEPYAIQSKTQAVYSCKSYTCICVDNVLQNPKSNTQNNSITKGFILLTFILDYCMFCLSENGCNKFRLS